MKDKRTTFAGIAAAALQLYANGVHPKQAAVAAAIAFLGYLAGDSAKNPAPPPPPPAQ
jgi:hypothetical protein